MSETTPGGSSGEHAGAGGEADAGGSSERAEPKRAWSGPRLTPFGAFPEGGSYRGQFRMGPGPAR